ncbi:hypothetical protein TNCV_2559751 [Trichonephila clavipes]|nr:hypothetical protein TNCV_2559751 [Trichonephila clavipes]
MHYTSNHPPFVRPPVIVVSDVDCNADGPGFEFRSFTCMVLKAKANDRRKNLALRRDEFRQPSSDVAVDQVWKAKYSLCAALITQSGLIIRRFVTSIAVEPQVLSLDWWKVKRCKRFSLSLSPEHPQGALHQDWGETEINRPVTCMVLKATANDRHHLALCHDEFRRL